MFEDPCDWGFVFEDALRVGKILGIDLNQKRVTLMNGSHRYDPEIYFSGFCHQGQDCNFRAFYAYKVRAPEEIRAYAPQDEELHRIADALEAVQKQYNCTIQASVSPRGRYLDMDVITDCDYPEDGSNLTLDYGGEIKELMHDFAHWIYKRLEAEYEYQNSGEAVDESLRIIEQEFYEDGEPA